MPLKRLTAYLRRAPRREQLHCPDARQAAKLFPGSVISDYHLRGLFGTSAKRITAAERANHVKAAVAMFLSHFAV